MRAIAATFALFHAVAQQHEGIVAHLIGCQIIRLVEIDIVDLVAGDKGIDLQRLVAVRHGGGHLVRLEDDILPILNLVAFDLIVTLDMIAGLVVDELAFHPVASLAVQRIEGDALRRRGGRI